MTPIDKMTAQELRIAVLIEKGWVLSLHKADNTLSVMAKGKVFPFNEIVDWSEVESGRIVFYGDAPDYTKDITEAMKLVEEIRDKLNWGFYVERQADADEWFVMFEPDEADKLFDFTAEEESLCAAICRAYLKCIK